MGKGAPTTGSMPETIPIFTKIYTKNVKPKLPDKIRPNWVCALIEINTQRPIMRR